MSTLEDQLRTTLSARAEAVTESMLTRSLPTLEADPEPDATPVIALPGPGPHRSRRMVAAVLAVAAVLLVAFGAVALHQATSDKRIGPAHVRPRSAIPWDKVGNGWMLQIAQPGTVDVPGGTRGWLYLIDPNGVSYSICKVPLPAYRYGFPEPTAWGQPFNTDRVILMLPIDNNRSSLLEINLRSGAQRTVTVLGHWATAEYVDAAGTSILLNNVDKMVTVSASTGKVEVGFAATEFFGSVVSKDRKQVVSGSVNTVSVFDVATGRVVRTLAPPAGYSYCRVVSWLSGATRFVARCQQIAKPHAMVTFDFSLGGTAPPVRPAVPAGWDEVDLAGGKIAIKISQPDLFRINGMSFARLARTGQLEPIAVPEELTHDGWSLEFVTPAGLVLDNTPQPDASPEDMAIWNPLTGHVEYVFRAVTTAGPHGLWAGWRTYIP